MALLQLNVTLGSLWLDRPITGTPFEFIFGSRATFRLRSQPPEAPLLSGPSLHSRLTRLVNLGAIGYRGHLRE